MEFEAFKALVCEQQKESDELLAMLGFLDGYYSYLDEILETGSVTVELDSKKFVLSLNIEEVNE